MRHHIIQTAHGSLETPFFMPIATRGAVKTVSSVDLEAIGSPVVLSNTYHLMLRPGADVIRAAGGLHRFMGWKRVILTDSGGYQVFSLAKRRVVEEEGVLFASPIDGSRHLLTPESSIEIQRALGSDIVMCFDEVVALPNRHEIIAEAVDRTTRWAKRCKAAFESTRDSSSNPDAKLLGIIQGGTDSELRRRSIEGLLEIGFDGYAIGGLSVGEPFEEACATLDRLMPMLPEDKPRYFMGGAQPHQIVEYVKRGIDMFDCVLPTRNARHGHLYRWVHGDLSRPNFYEVINIVNAKWNGDQSPLLDSNREAAIDHRLSAIGQTEGTDGRAGAAGVSGRQPSADGRRQFIERELSRFSLGYLHHLFDVQEMLAYRLATINNLAFYLDLFELIRQRRGEA